MSPTLHTGNVSRISTTLPSPSLKVVETVTVSLLRVESCKGPKVSGSKSHTSPAPPGTFLTPRQPGLACTEVSWGHWAGGRGWWDGVSHLGIFPGPFPIFSSLLTVPLQQDQKERSASKHPPSPSLSSQRAELSHSPL